MHHVESLFNGNESSDDLLRYDYARPPPICVQYGVVGHIGGTRGGTVAIMMMFAPMTPPNSNINWPGLQMAWQVVNGTPVLVAVHFPLLHL